MNTVWGRRSAKFVRVERVVLWWRTEGERVRRKGERRAQRAMEEASNNRPGDDERMPRLVPRSVLMA